MKAGVELRTSVASEVGWGTYTSYTNELELPDWKIADIVAKNSGVNPGAPGVFLNPSVTPDDESLKLLLPEEE